MGAHRLDTLRARRILGGFSVAELAKRGNLDDWIVQHLEDGGSCQAEVTQRLVDALGGGTVALASNSQVSPTVFTVTAGHAYQTGDSIVIAGVTGANADPNGTRVVTRINGTTFSVPIDCSIAGGTGGTATLQPASLGIARLT